MQAGQPAPGQLRRFTALQAIYWSTIATFYAYVITMLLDQGIPSDLVGFLSSVLMLGCLVGQFAVSYISDRLKTCKKVFMAVSLLLQVFCIALYYTENTLMRYGLMFLLGFCKQPLGAVLDTWFLKSVTSDMRLYGKTRSGGSIGYSCTSLLYGFLLSRLGYGIMPWVSLVSTAVLLWLCAVTPEAPLTAPVQRREVGASAVIKALAPLALFFASITLLGIINTPVYSLFPVILQEYGGTAAYQGLACFLNSGMEAPAMLMRWERVGFASPNKRLLCAFLLYIACSVVIAYARSVWLVILGFGLTGFAYGMQLHARRELVARKAPAALQSTMHGIGDMLLSGVGGIVGSALLGISLNCFGRVTSLLLCAGLQTVSLLLFLLSCRGGKKKNAPEKLEA